MINLTNFQRHIGIADGINAIYELGFVADEHKDRFLELVARPAEGPRVAAAVDALPLDLLMPKPKSFETVDNRWYRGRFATRVPMRAAVSITPEREKMFRLLVAITGLAAPGVLAKESPVFRALRERNIELERFENRRYLKAHGRASRSSR